MKKSTLVIIILIIIIVLLVVGIIYLLNKDKINGNNLSGKEEDLSSKVSENITEEARIRIILNDISNKTDFNDILKSTTGDVSASKITKEEFDSKIEDYIKILTGDKEVFNSVEEDGNEYLEYEVEKVLNKLGLVSYKGAEIKTEVQIIYFYGNDKGRISKRQAAIAVLKDILEKSNFDGIYKSTTGDVTAPKMSKREFSSAINEYSKAILVNEDLLKIYKEKEKNYVEYEVEKVLNELGLSTNKGVGIKNGVQKIEVK